MTTAGFADLKAGLRREALKRRTALGAEARDAFTARLVAEGLALARRCGARTASAFYPIRGEPDTRPLLAALAEAGVATALPVSVSRALPLTFRRWRVGEPTTPGELNIPEPLPEAEAVQPDLLFVPLACFDQRGHRIGFGAGHYDRTLAALRAEKPICAVGVAYATSEIEAAPDEPHDERMDFILTDKELIDCRGAI